MTRGNKQRKLEEQQPLAEQNKTCVQSNIFPVCSRSLSICSTKTKIKANAKPKQLYKKKCLCIIISSLFRGPQGQVVSQQLHDQSGIFVVAVIQAV